MALCTPSEVRGLPLFASVRSSLYVKNMIVEGWAAILVICHCPVCQRPQVFVMVGLPFDVADPAPAASGNFANTPNIIDGLPGILCDSCAVVS